VTDNLTREQRSKVMASIRGKNTKPELIIRKILWSGGFRYRIHDKSVYGTPDISNKRRKLAVFIDGCFWHGCKKCYKEPATNTVFWREKIRNNKKRRMKVRRELKKQGWVVQEFWEHQINSKPEKIANIITGFLNRKFL